VELGPPAEQKERKHVMHYGSFWGMSFLWWIFWVALIAVFFSLATPVWRTHARFYNDPLSILRRRYASGEITTEEYDERKSRLQKDDEASRSSRDLPRIDRHQPA
jgi:putative membrane protein